MHTDGLDYQFDIIFTFIDILYWGEHWKAIDTIVNDVIKENWDLTLLTCLLTTTLCIKNKLQNRHKLYEYTLCIAKSKYGKNTNVLEGLE